MEKKSRFAITGKAMIIFSVILSSGCVASNKASQGSSAEASPAVQSEAANGSENVVWHISPTIPATEVRMIYPGIGEWRSQTGYPQEWVNTGYPDNAVMLVTNGWGRIMDFDGNVLNETDISLAHTQLDEDDVRGTAMNYGDDDYGTGYIYIDDSYNYYLSNDFSSISSTLPVGLCDCDEPTERDDPAIINNTFGTLHFDFSKADDSMQEFFPGDYASFALSDRNIVSTFDENYKINGYGVVDKNGSIIYTSTHSINGNGLDFPAIINNRFFETDHEVDLSSYSYYFDVVNESMISGRDNSKKLALINAETGEHLTDYLYDEALYFEDGYCPVEKNGKWGYIDDKGDEVTDFIFDSASALYQGLAYVSINDTFGVLDLKTTLDQGTPVTLSTCYDSFGGVPDSSQQLRILGTVTTSYDNVNIRSGAGTSYEKLGHMNIFGSYPVYEKQEADGYSWLLIGNNEWVANDGTDAITRFLEE